MDARRFYDTAIRIICNRSRLFFAIYITAPIITEPFFLPFTANLAKTVGRVISLLKYRINTGFFCRVLLSVELVLPTVEDIVEQSRSVVDGFGATFSFQRFTTLL